MRSCTSGGGGIACCGGEGRGVGGGEVSYCSLARLRGSIESDKWAGRVGPREIKLVSIG